MQISDIPQAGQPPSTTREGFQRSFPRPGISIILSGLIVSNIKIIAWPFFKIHCHSSVFLSLFFYFIFFLTVFLNLSAIDILS